MSIEKPAPQELELSEKPYPYDALIVLGGGLKKIKDKYYPTDYRDSDNFGMLGAGLRMVAAVDLYLNKKIKNLVFSTGITEKNKEKFGQTVPNESTIYKNKFEFIVDQLKKRQDKKEIFKNLEKPNIIEEDKSCNTITNIQEVLQIIKDNGWQHVAILSSDYHISRVKALYESALQQIEYFKKIKFEFLSAEELVKKIEPGKYDNVISRYYDSDQAEARKNNEQQGLDDLKSGTYEFGEFQLKNKN